MPLGIRWRALGGELEAVDDLADHEPRVGEDVVGAVGEPRLDGVDRARLARRDAPAVLAALGARGTWRRAGRRAASASVSAAQATCQSWAWTTSGRHGRAGSTAGRGGGSPTRPGRRGRRRAATAGRCGHAARARRRSIAVGRRSRVGQREQRDVVAGRASAWLSPSTWAATPPTDRGGNSQVSIRTRIGARTLTPAAALGHGHVADASVQRRAGRQRQRLVRRAACSRRRLPRQMRRSTVGPPTAEPTGRRATTGTSAPRPT